MNVRTALHACVVGLLLSGCGTAVATSSLRSVDPAAVRFANQTAAPTASASDPVELVTYVHGSACESVQRTTSITSVPAACAAAWRRFGVTTVPGQDLLRQTPHFPTVTVKRGIDRALAARMAVALWRTESFQWFALGTRQLGVVDGLGANFFFRQVGIEEEKVAAGEAVTTPMCHFFPVAIRVVPLEADLAAALHDPTGALGVEATYQGPCYATATDSHGRTTQLFSFTGKRSVVYLGVIARGDPEGPVLALSNLAECEQPVARATCAQ